MLTLDWLSQSPCHIPPAASMHSPSLYDALGVPATASLSEIRAAYKALAFKCHPDINPSAGKAGHREFVAATEAFQILRDGAKRAEYDRVLAFQRATEALQAGKPWDASHGAGPTPWGWEGPPRPAGRAAQREPLDDVFEDILRRMGQPGCAIGCSYAPEGREAGCGLQFDRARGGCGGLGSRASQGDGLPL